jgi:hypothetical protein
MNDRPSDIALAKLPQWAQRYIDNLEMKLGEAKRELHEHLAQNPQSEFAIQRFVVNTDEGPDLTFLPKERTILAFLDTKYEASKIDRGALALKVMEDIPGNRYLQISTWSGYPSVRPQAANVIHVHLEERK